MSTREYDRQSPAPAMSGHPVADRATAKRGAVTWLTMLAAVVAVSGVHAQAPAGPAGAGAGTATPAAAAVAASPAAHPVATTRLGIGRAPTDAELRGWDIDIAPDGTGLPAGSGNVTAGRALFAERCVACHGVDGKGGPAGPLAGGGGSLAGKSPVKTVGSFWPHSTTLFDYIRRAMPWDRPQSLRDDEVYALSAYVLHVNGIVPADAVMDAKSLPAVRMPNRDGFYLFEGQDIAPERCMEACR